jgi:hypothetical protein
MVAGWIRLGVLGIFIGSVVGCVSASKLKPPKQPEEYVVPPNDSRYNGYQTYPARILGEGRIKAGLQQDPKDMNPGFTQGGPPR